MCCELVSVTINRSTLKQNNHQSFHYCDQDTNKTKYYYMYLYVVRIDDMYIICTAHTELRTYICFLYKYIQTC